MSAPSLTDFLLTRIAEDEAAARAARDAVRDWGCPPVVAGELGTHIARHDPARVLADCKAKRRIVETHRAWDENDWQSPPYFSAPMDEVLACLALPYADHPDYQEAWRPEPSRSTS